MFRVSVITLYPDIFPGTLGFSIFERARKRNLWSLDVWNLRDFANSRHRCVDDTPAGGGAGMVLRADVVGAALDAFAGDARPMYCLSPRGAVFHQGIARSWAGQGDGLIFLCGRFEGVDARVFQAYPVTEISLGDFVLSGGEVAAIAMLEATLRLVPGITGSADSLCEESFNECLLEYPQYTRPFSWKGLSVPDVLVSGHHQKIASWRKEKAIQCTQERRPDLYAQYVAGNMAEKNVENS